MLERGRGHLVYVSSLAGTSSFPGLSAYCASKAGITNFAATVRRELARAPVNVTLVAAGPVDTQMWEHVESGPESVQAVARRLQRLHLMPIASPDWLAMRVVRAVEKKRRHVRVPRRLLLQYSLGEAPRRITELCLAGVRFDPMDRGERKPS